MAESKRTTQAILWSALLHVGVAAFLFLTTLSCTKWESVFTAFGLPSGWNPMSCAVPLSYAGPVIDATLVGPTRAPPAPATKAKSPQQTAKEKPAQPAKTEPPQKASPPKQEQPTPAKTPPPEKAKPTPVKTLPAPPKHPAARDQQKVVAMAKQKAEQAKRAQEEKEKQRMAELQAQQEHEEKERKQQEQAKLAAERARQQKQQQAAEEKKRQQKLDEIFKQLDAARQNSKAAEKASQHAEKAVPEVKDHKPAKTTTSTEATQAAAQPQSGANGTAKAAYIAALQNAVTQAWLRPDNIPDGTVCQIHIVQIPGGQVVSVKVEASCPFDAAGRRSVKNAVLRAEPLPYKGFEDVFRTDVIFNFTVK